MKLSETADFVTTQELAEHLIKQLEELIEEYNSGEHEGTSFQDYLNGLIAAKESVLLSIGASLESLPKYEDLGD